MAFLLALALVVSVMSGLGLSVSAEQESNTPGTEEVQQQDKTEAGAAPSEVKAEEEAAKPEEKPVSEEKKDEQKTEAKENADKPAEKQEKATPKAGENVQTATIGTGDKTVTVKTTAAAGVLPEGAKLVVKKLANQDQAYQDAESTLKDSQVTYDDFLALDVGFEVNGKEVEPEAGSVQVQFELGAGLLPETADTSTLAVQHLTDGKAEMVADAGAVTAGDSAIKANFEVDSFSTFTVTWKVTNRLKATIELSAVTRADTNSGFDNLFGQSSVGTATMNTGDSQFVFADHKGKNITYGGKTYTATGKVYIEHDSNYVEVTSLKKKTVEKDFWGRTGYVIYAVGEGLAEPTSIDDSAVVWYGYSGKSTSYDGKQRQKLYLEYNTTPDSGSTGDVTVDVSSLSHEKYITKNTDGTYDLTLSVAGATGSSTKKKEIDVLLIVDKSGSMQDTLAGGNNDNYSKSRWKASKDAIQTLIDNFNANKDKLDVKYSIVTFSGSKGNWDSTWNDAEVNQEWAYSNEFTVSNSDSWDQGSGVLDFAPEGGTNYAAGFREGKSQLKTARSTAQKVVIFLSDGEPTYYYNSKGMTVGAGNADADDATYYGVPTSNPGSCSRAAYTEASGITNANYFYTIGLGTESSINKDVLKTLSEKVAASSKGCTVNTNNAPFMCTSLDELKKVFANISAEVQKFACKNVQITDFLSDNVNIVEVNAGKEDPYNFRISMKKADGTSGTVPDGTNASYVAEEKKVILKFPEKYELEAGATYFVTFTVEPSDLAYQKYAQSGGVYTDKGEEGTGEISAGKDGYFSNAKAEVSYVYKNESRTEPYNKPVVQVDAAMITVTKTATGLPESEANKEFTFTITSNNAIADELYSAYLKKGSTGTVSGNTLTLKNGQSATFVYKAGTTLTFTENQEAAKVAGYDLSVSGTANGTMTINGTNLNITNAYTPSNRTITLKKVVGGNMGDTNKEFQFSVSKNATMSGNGKLKDNGETTITAKVGETVTITEDDYTSDGYTTTAGGVTGGTYNEDAHSYTFTVTKDMNTNTVITFTHTKTINPPSGITTTIAPYAIMVVLAAGAGVYFVYSRRRRNR